MENSSKIETETTDQSGASIGEIRYGGVSVDNVPEIVSEHVIAGRPIERLTIAEHWLNLLCARTVPLLSRAAESPRPALSVVLYFERDK